MKKVTSSWFFLSTLNYDARSTTHQIPFECATGSTTKEHNLNVSEAWVLRKIFWRKTE